MNIQVNTHNPDQLKVPDDLIKEERAIADLGNAAKRLNIKTFVSLKDFRELYFATSHLIRSPEGKEKLEVFLTNIEASLKDYLGSTRAEFIKSKQDVVSPIETAEALTTLHDLQEEIGCWPPRFGPLLPQVRVIAKLGILTLEKQIRLNGEALKAVFFSIVEEHTANYQTLKERVNQKGVASEVLEISKALKSEFSISLQIEDFCGWRLGVKNRNPYRRLGRNIEADFGIETKFPDVPMDPGHTPVGRRIQKN